MATWTSDVVNFELEDDNNLEDGATIKDYLSKLLTKLIQEEEGFNGKRPFGNSGWMHDLYAPLIREGVVAGSYNEGYYEIEDYDAGDEVINKCIEYIFNGIDIEIPDATSEKKDVWTIDVIARSTHKVCFEYAVTRNEAMRNYLFDREVEDVLDEMDTSISKVLDAR